MYDRGNICGHIFTFREETPLIFVGICVILLNSSVTVKNTQASLYNASGIQSGKHSKGETKYENFISG